MSVQIPLEALPAINKVIDLAEQALRELIGYRVELQITVPYSEAGDKLLQRLVSEAFGLTWEQIKQPGRRSEYVQARHAYAYLADMLLGKSLSAISRDIGRGDHTTALYAVRQIQKAVLEEQPVAKVLTTIIQTFKRHEIQINPPGVSGPVHADDGGDGQPGTDDHRGEAAAPAAGAHIPETVRPGAAGEGPV